MNIILFIFDFILHIDTHLGEIISAYGFVTYTIMFVIIFIETGLVFTPFLPGDSLLFAAGAFAALGSLNIVLVILLLIIAAILGDTCNYWIGHFFGEKLVANPKVPLNKNHITETQNFFDKHGGKTIVLARFVPIIRTFAPFVAGIGRMSYKHFIYYNVLGGILWVSLGSLAGYFFGNIPFFKQNFSTIILAVILISILPILIPIGIKIVKKTLNRFNS